MVGFRVKTSVRRFWNVEITSALCRVTQVRFKWSDQSRDHLKYCPLFERHQTSDQTRPNSGPKTPKNCLKSSLHFNLHYHFVLRSI